MPELLSEELRRLDFTKLVSEKHLGLTIDAFAGAAEVAVESRDISVAARILARWHDEVRHFVKVFPKDYKRVLDAKAEALEEGLDDDEAEARIMEVLHG